MRKRYCVRNEDEVWYEEDWKRYCVRKRYCARKRCGMRKMYGMRKSYSIRIGIGNIKEIRYLKKVCSR